MQRRLDGRVRPRREEAPRLQRAVQPVDRHRRGALAALEAGAHPVAERVREYVRRAHRRRRAERRTLDDYGARGARVTQRVGELVVALEVLSRQAHDERHPREGRRRRLVILRHRHPPSSTCTRAPRALWSTDSGGAPPPCPGGARARA